MAAARRPAVRAHPASSAACSRRYRWRAERRGCRTRRAGLYLAGSFTGIADSPATTSYPIDIASRTLTAWNPNAHASGARSAPRGVLTIRAAHGRVEVGGDFQRTSGVLHRGLALFRGAA